MSKHLGEMLVASYGLMGDHAVLNRFMAQGENGTTHHNMGDIVITEGQELVFYLDDGVLFLAQRKRLRKIWEPKDDAGD